MGFLNLSAAIVTASTRYPVLNDKKSAVIVERFILEQFNLMKDVVSETKVLVLYLFMCFILGNLQLLKVEKLH